MDQTSTEDQFNVKFFAMCLILVAIPMSCCASVVRTLVPPDSKVHWANMGSTWGRQDPGGPHVGPMDFAIWAYKHNRIQFKKSI